MTVKIVSDELFEAYKDAMAFPTKFTQFKHFCNIIGQYNDCDDRFMQEVMNILNALMTDEPVKLVEPEFFCYIEIPNCGVLNALQISHGNGYGSTFIHLGDFDEGYNYRFNQLEVDELKKRYSYIKTKEVEE